MVSTEKKPSLRSVVWPAIATPILRVGERVARWLADQKGFKVVEPVAAARSAGDSVVGRTLNPYNGINTPRGRVPVKWAEVDSGIPANDTRFYKPSGEAADFTALVRGYTSLGGNRFDRDKILDAARENLGRGWRGAIPVLLSHVLLRDLGQETNRQIEAFKMMRFYFLVEQGMDMTGLHKEVLRELDARERTKRQVVGLAENVLAAASGDNRAWQALVAAGMFRGKSDEVASALEMTEARAGELPMGIEAARNGQIVYNHGASHFSRRLNASFGSGSEDMGWNPFGGNASGIAAISLTEEYHIGGEHFSVDFGSRSKTEK